MTSKQVSVNTQQISSIIRQVAAIAALVMGALSSPPILNLLPTGFSVVLGVAGAAILAIEHYVSDPSTGSPPVAPLDSTTKGLP